MERVQEILGFKDDSEEICNGKTAYIHPIWHVLFTFIAFI